MNLKVNETETKWDWHLGILLMNSNGLSDIS